MRTGVKAQYLDPSVRRFYSEMSNYLPNSTIWTMSIFDKGRNFIIARALTLSYQSTIYYLYHMIQLSMLSIHPDYPYFFISLLPQSLYIKNLICLLVVKITKGDSQTGLHCFTCLFSIVKRIFLLQPCQLPYSYFAV